MMFRRIIDSTSSDSLDPKLSALSDSNAATTGVRGVRNSCESIAKKLSFALFAASIALVCSSITDSARRRSAIAPANIPGGNFSDFLSGAIKDSIGTMRQGEHAASQQVQGKANLVDVVQSVNAAELTLDTVVAVRDKVVAAYQSIMNMPI